MALLVQNTGSEPF